MTAAAWPFVSLGLAVVIQVGVIAYWGGRISHRLEALERRMGRLEVLDEQRPPVGWSARAAVGQ